MKPYCGHTFLLVPETASAELDDDEIGRRLERLQPGGANAPEPEEGELMGRVANRSMHESDEERQVGRSGTEEALEAEMGHRSGGFADPEKGDSDGLASFDGIEGGEGSAKKKKRGFVQRHRCTLCCVGSCCAIFILIVGICALVGYLLFRPKAPGIGLDNLKVNDFSPKFTIIPPRATLNFNVSGTLSLSNPNYFSLTYYNTSAYVLYRNTSLATIPVDRGHVPARANRELNLSAVGRDFAVVSQLRALTTDVNNQRVPLTVNTNIPGKWSVLGLVRHGFEVRRLPKLSSSDMFGSLFLMVDLVFGLAQLEESRDFPSPILSCSRVSHRLQ